MPIKALILKELRSAGLVIGLAGAAYAVFVIVMLSDSLLSGASREWANQYDLANTDGAMFYCMLTAAFCAAMGMHASSGEARGKCWQFVLFRPVSRRALVAVKAATGAVACGFVSLLPLLAYFGWATRPGVVAAPFDVSCLWPTGVVWLWSPVMFLAAFLAGLREGRWLWSKSWPLLLVVLVGFWLWFMPLVEMWSFDISESWIAAAWVLCVVVLVTSLLSVAEEQDFS